MQTAHPTLPENETPCQPAVPAVPSPRPLSRVPRDLKEDLKLAAPPSLGEPCAHATALGASTSMQCWLEPGSLPHKHEGPHGRAGAWCTGDIASGQQLYLQRTFSVLGTDSAFGL